MALYVTGDMHGNFKRLSKKNRMKLPFEIVAGDYLIISGDFGLLWTYDKEYEYNLKMLSQLPFTILWIQGNHENYNMIKDFELEEWNGGQARHIIRDKIILLERGQVFNIQGNTIFTFGGAESHDIDGGILDRNDPQFKLKKHELKKLEKSFRIINESWWKEELPSEDELNIGLANLAKHDYKVDYIITHCGPTEHHIKADPTREESNLLINYFNNLDKEVEFKKWYFGHYHIDMETDSKHRVLYKDIIKLGN